MQITGMLFTFTFYVEKGRKIYNPLNRRFAKCIAVHSESDKRDSSGDCIYLARERRLF